MEVMTITILIAAVCNLILGFLVYKSDPKNNLHRWYGIFGLITGIWVLSNYLISIFSTVFWIKTVYAIGALVPASALMWIFYFCEAETRRKKKIVLLFVAAVFFIIPFIDKLFLFNIKKVYLGGVDGEYGPAFYLYIVYMFWLSAYMIYELILKYKKSSDIKKMQTEFVLIGTFIWMFFVLMVDFVLPIFGISQYIPLDTPASLVFLIFTAYAITKHRLFDVKVIATELLTFLLCITLLLKTLSSETPQDWALNGIILALVVSFGILLVRGVIKEVEQKDKMEKMAGDVKKAYEAEKLAKEKVEAAQVEDEALLTSIGDGVVAIDKEGKIMFINRAAQELLGFKSEDVIDKPYEEILTIENEKGEAILGENNPLRQALSFGKKIVTDAAGGAMNTVYYYVRADKTKFPVAITVAPVILDGKTIGAIDVFRDVTVERQLDKSKSEFVSLASHQLRTPLTAIKWYSEVLQKENNLSAKAKRCLREIYHGNERMIKLIDIMLNISRFEAGKIKMNAAPTDIKKILGDIINEQKSEIKKRSQKFIFECPNDLPEVSLDQNLFRLIFQNLLSNAIKYTPNNGQVSCKVEKKDNVFSFEVADTGIGIPEAQQKRVFEKLFRADNAFTYEPEGTGLGLYAAKMTAESLGGKIWFKSKEGKGTTFFVELPIVISDHT